MSGEYTGPPCSELDLLREVHWAASVCIECPFPAPCQIFCSQGVNIPKIIFRSALALSKLPPDRTPSANNGEWQAEPGRPPVPGP
jgi:hypothetical protein